MSNSLSSYLPSDRLRALLSGKPLPDRANGTALFADISGFTPFTEKLTRELGPRRGAEALTRHLNEVYTALIAEVERAGGSVISFAGDAILCWFDQPTGRQAQKAMRCAVRCAFALQTAMQQFPYLGLKVTLASGPSRRFLVGDPAFHCLDILAGDAVVRAANGNTLARKGEILLDAATATALAAGLNTQEWRTEAESGQSFTVAQAFSMPCRRRPPAPVNIPPNPDILRPFLPARVFEREARAENVFLTEFRPCVGLFVQFSGIDYNADQAPQQLDDFIRLVQAVAAEAEGALLQLTIGDKGSFLYINFGVFVTYEDDARRALKTALAMQEVSPLPLRMGVASGVMRVGAYGSASRRSYGAISDEVNLAARLMQTAGVGEILVSGPIQRVTDNYYAFAARGLLQIKGKAEPTPTFALLGECPPNQMRLQEPVYALPMVGRQAELAHINHKLDLALQGQSQVVALLGEAGMGKSRLVAEVIRSAHAQGFVGYGGAAQSQGEHTPYLVWKSIWQAFFEVDAEAPPGTQIEQLQAYIAVHAPARQSALPLLGALLGVNIPDNAFTSGLEPQNRRSVLHALLEDCLKAAARTEPLLLVLDDLHWMDVPSQQLLEGLARGLSSYPVCFLLVYRPSQQAASITARLSNLPQFTQLSLKELDEAEARTVLRARLAHLYPGWSGDLPPQMTEKMLLRAQGNPFYLEELLNYLHDCGLEPGEVAEMEKLELPGSLHTLILSRIDQLSESEKNTLRAASIIGRMFYARWLHSYCPELGSREAQLRDLEHLAILDITPLHDSPQELSYLFKHIITHEVAYESLLYAARARLHERLAQYIESLSGQGSGGAHTGQSEKYLDLLAFHYGRSENYAKQREYFRKAGNAAEIAFANQTALEYYQRLLPLLEDTGEKIAIYAKMGLVCEMMGQYECMGSSQHAILELAGQTGGHAAEAAAACITLGRLCRIKSQFDQGRAWLEQALAECRRLNQPIQLSSVLTELAHVLVRQGDYAQAGQCVAEALIWTDHDPLAQAYVLVQASFVDTHHGNQRLAWSKLERALTLYEGLANQTGIARVLLNLGSFALDQGDYAAAQSLSQRAFVIYRELGSKPHLAVILLNLSQAALAQGDFQTARTHIADSLTLYWEISMNWGVAADMFVLSSLERDLGNAAAALSQAEKGLELATQMDDKFMISWGKFRLGLAQLALNTPAHMAPAWQNLAASLRLRQEIAAPLPSLSSLIGLAGLALQARQPERAACLLGAVDAALSSLGLRPEVDTLHFHSQTLAAARAALSSETFAAAWQRGAALVTDEENLLAQVVAFALQENL